MTVNRDSLDNVWGPASIDKWADLQNNGDPDHIDSRVSWAISLATLEVRRRIATTVYAWADVSTDALVEHAISIRAGLHLYANRAIVEQAGGKEGSPIKEMQRMYDDFFEALSAGELFLGDEDDAINKNVCTPYPFVVKQVEDNDLC